MIILGSLETCSGLPIIVLAEVFSLGVTAEAVRANIGSKSAISLHHRLQHRGIPAWLL